MKQKKETEPMITAAEAVRNSAFSTAYDLNFCYEIYKKYRSAGNQYNDELLDTMCVFACMYNAGYVQGIREERAKAKQKKHRKECGA